MTLTPYQIGRFRGLNFAETVDTVGSNEAIDLLNISFARPGGIAVREGTAKFNSVAAGTAITSVYGWPRSTSSAQVIALSATNMYAYSSSGTLVASAVQGSLGTKALIASIGTGTAGPYVYVALQGATTLERWDGAAWTAPATVQVMGAMLAVQPNDNRLVTANPTPSTASRVRFSDAGAPETFGANNYIDLHPNDGQTVRGLVAWQNYLFAFKDRKYAVFYGNSTDGTGNPVFNYRMVDTGIGLGSYSIAPTTYAAAPEGVYFVAPSGVYLTTGGPPRKVSRALDPLFTGTVAVQGFSLTNFVAPFQPTGLAYTAGRLFLTATNGNTTAFYTFVYWAEQDTWSLWSMSFNPLSFTDVQLGGGASDVVCNARTTGFMYKLDPTLTADDGTAIASRYRSGFYSPGGSSARETVIRESLIDGTGTPTFSVSKDFATSLPTTGGGAKATVTLGTAPAIARGRHRVSQKGTRFSWQAEASSGYWQIDSIAQMIRGTRPPGIDST